MESSLSVSVPYAVMNMSSETGWCCHLLTCLLLPAEQLQLLCCIYGIVFQTNLFPCCDCHPYSDGHFPRLCSDFLGFCFAL